MRAALLYWDAIDLPENNIIEVSDQLMKHLATINGVSRSYFSFTSYSGAPGTILPDVMDRAFRVANEDSPGRWSLGQIEGCTGFSNAGLAESGAASVRIANAIPIPPRETPFEDILEFRRRRHSELQALRLRLDELSERLANSEDPERVFAHIVDEIDHAITDQIRVSHERWGIAERISLQPSFNISNAAKAGWASAASGIAAGLPLTTAALAGLGAAACAGVDLSLAGRKRHAPLEGRAYRYVIAAHKDLG